MNHKNNEYVLPGDILCTYEQYIPSDWTYIEDGYIKASICGRLVIDEVNKEISIDSVNAPRRLKVDDKIIGNITEVNTNKALITIKKIIDSDRELITGYKGYIHISKAINEYVQTLHYLFKIGDIVEARVVNIYGPDYVELSTSDDDCGVIKAMCVDCREFMDLDCDNTLKCKCGKKDMRKISKNYGGLK